MPTGQPLLCVCPNLLSTLADTRGIFSFKNGNFSRCQSCVEFHEKGPLWGSFCTGLNQKKNYGQKWAGWFTISPKYFLGKACLCPATCLKAFYSQKPFQWCAWQQPGTTRGSDTTDGPLLVMGDHNFSLLFPLAHGNA